MALNDSGFQDSEAGANGMGSPLGEHDYSPQLSMLHTSRRTDIERLSQFAHAFERASCLGKRHAVV